MRKILLAGRERYALPILQPLVDALNAANYRVYAWFDGPLAAQGATLSQATRVATREAISLRPAAVLCAMNWIPTFFAGAKVQLFHGFSTGKNSDHRGHFRIRGLFDLYCTQGPDTTERFVELSLRAGSFAVMETGWPKLDPLFGVDAGPSEQLRRLAGGRGIVMFASTFTRHVSAAPHLFESIRRQVQRGDRYWLITLHPKCPAELFSRYRSLAGPSATFVEPEDLMNAERAADVLLSDTTSVVPEFLVQHKPVVTFRHRNPPPCILDIRDPAGLDAALAAAFGPSPELMASIAAYAHRIHPYRDGRSSQRVIGAVEKLLAGGLGQLKPKPFAARIRALQMRWRLRYWGPGARGSRVQPPDEQPPER